MFDLSKGMLITSVIFSTLTLILVSIYRNKRYKKELSKNIDLINRDSIRVKVQIEESKIKFILNIILISPIVVVLNFLFKR